MGRVALGGAKSSRPPWPNERKTMIMSRLSPKTPGWCLALLLAAVASCLAGRAADEGELPINGGFRGQPSDASPVPGWTVSPEGGSARVLPAKNGDDFLLELRAPSDQSLSATSALCPVDGGTVRLALTAVGTGRAHAGVEAFDASRDVMVAESSIPFMASLLALAEKNASAPFTIKTEVKFDLPRTARFVRIKLTAEAGAFVTFRSVKAVSARQSPSVPAGGVKVMVNGKAMWELLNCQSLSYQSLGRKEDFAATAAVGQDFVFTLEESRDAPGPWRVMGHAPFVNVELTQESDDGVPKARVKVKSQRPGTVLVPLTCGHKVVAIYLTVK